MPAAVAPDFVPLHTAVKYVAAAYIVVLVVVVVYLAIMALRLTRNARDLAELRRMVDEREAHGALTGLGLGEGDEPSRSDAGGADLAATREAEAEAIRQEHQL